MSSSGATGRRGHCFKVWALRGKQNRRLECCATYRNFVFIGVSDGFEVSQVALSPVTNDWEIKVKQIITLARRQANVGPVTQISILGELKIVVVLSDGMLSLYDCDFSSSLTRDSDKIVAPEPRTSSAAGLKECTMFTIKKAEGVYTLAALQPKQRKLSICQWRTNTFDVIKDFALPPEPPKAILWSGAKLLLCFPLEYSAMDMDQGKTTKIFEPKDQPGAAYIHGFNENLILVQSCYGARIKHDGKPTSKNGVKWSSHPKEVVYSHPYLLSLHSNSVEVHFPHFSHLNTKQTTFCQQLQMQHVDKISGVNYVDYDATNPTQRNSMPPTPMERDSIVVMMNDGSLRLLNMAPIDQQVKTLFIEKQFDDATSLCQLCTNEVSDKLRGQLILQHGNHLFESGDYEATVSKFSASQIDPRYLISYFPDFMPDTCRTRWTPPIAIDNQAVLTVGTTGAGAKRGEYPEGAVRALLSYIQPLRGVPPADHRYPLRDQLLKDASDRTCQLAAIDSAFLHCLSALDHDVGDVLRKPNFVVFESLDARFRRKADYTSLGLLYLSVRDPKEISSALELLRHVAYHGNDTAFHVTADSTLVGKPIAELVRKLVADGALNSDRYYDMGKAQKLVETCAAFWQSSKKEKLSALSAEERMLLAQQLMAVTATVFMLKQLDGENVENEAVIETFSHWILREFPASYAVSMFLKSDRDTTRAVRPLRVADLLRVNPKACNEYLRALMGDDCNAVDEPALHDRRVEALVAIVNDEPDQGTKKLVVEELVQFMHKSKLFNARDAKAAFEGISAPSLDIVRPRTMALRRLGEHEDAIKLLLANKMRKEAEQYARDVNEDSRKHGGHEDAFKYLLAAYVRPASNETPDIAAALQIVKSNPTINIVSALNVLPSNVKLRELSDVFMTALRTSQSDARYRQISMNLLKTKLRGLQVQSATESKKMVVVREDLKCLACGGGFKKTNIVRYPNGNVYHQNCAPDLHVDPVKGTDFRKDIDLL
jgi:hypothetical protein